MRRSRSRAGQDVIFTSFGDMLRVPGTRTDLLAAKARGADVRMVYSPLDAVDIARANPSREVVFFAVGFETTAPANAMAVHRAAREGLHNFSLLVSHVLVPPAIEAILGSPGNRVQGFLAAGHVCTVMGFEEYEPLARRYHVPIVVTGFEPLDILQGVTMCVRQLEEGRSEVENQYSRSVRREGNTEAQRLIREVFDSRPRGAGAASVRLPRAVWACAGRTPPTMRRRFPVDAASGRGAGGMYRRPGPAGSEEAGRLPRVRDPVHARAAAGRPDGLVRGRVCRLLSLPSLGARGDRAMNEKLAPVVSGSRSLPDRDSTRPWRRRPADAPASRAAGGSRVPQSPSGLAS